MFAPLLVFFYSVSKMIFDGFITYELQVVTYELWVAILGK